MNNKTMVVLIILLCLLFTFPAISATDTNDDQLTATVIDESDNITDISTDDINILKSGLQENLGAGEKTFTDLNALIQGSSGEITLKDNYKYTPGTDDAYKNGIVISNSITINGNGIYTIDGANQARIFNVTGNNVILNGLIFKNGNSSDGGSIYSSGDNS